MTLPFRPTTCAWRRSRTRQRIGAAAFAQGVSAMAPRLIATRTRSASACTTKSVPRTPIAAIGVLRRKCSRAASVPLPLMERTTPARRSGSRCPAGGSIVAIGFDHQPAAGPDADESAVDEAQMDMTARLGLDAVAGMHGHAARDGVARLPPSIRRVTPMTNETVPTASPPRLQPATASNSPHATMRARASRPARCFPGIIMSTDGNALCLRLMADYQPFRTANVCLPSQFWNLGRRPASRHGVRPPLSCYPLTK